MNHWKHIGLQIAQARKARHWTMQDLGDRVGENRQNINHIEKGNRPVSIEKLTEIAVVLGIKITIPAHRNNE